MEVIYFSNEFPTADLQDVFRLLHNRSKDRQYPFLAQLISETTLAVKEEIQQLPSKLNELIPPFTSLFEWAEHTELREGLLCGSVDGVLLVLSQLALYISHVESGTKQHEPSSTRLTALGVGLFSAAALASSSHISDLPSRGAEAVRIAFRMGIHVQAVSHQLEPRNLDDSSATWAYVVHNVAPIEAQAELDALHAAAAASPTSRIFISAISRTSVTVSGPPSRLRGLFQRSKMFRDATSIPLPVFGGLCHAPHIYGPQDAQAIVQHNKRALTGTPQSTVFRQLHSTSTGAPYHVGDDGDLFGSVVLELLTKSIEWDKVVSNLVDTFNAEGSSVVTLSCFGNSIPLRDLQRGLQENKIDFEFTNYLTSLTEHAGEDTGPRGTAQAKLAIVGMSCRLPGATDLEQFWSIMEEGRDMSRRIPADRFDIDTHYDPEGKEMNKCMTQYGCFIDEPGLFDASFFNMSPREAMVVDPQMRLSLVTAYEALEQAGVVVNRTPSTKAQRIGTYYGQAADDYREVNQGQEVGTYYIPGGCRAFGPGRINYFFKFSGPSYSIDTACSSGLAAIEVACQALWNGDVDTAVAGGVNILTNPDGFTGLGKGHFLTKGHNACKTWDATADGYCRADGVGSVVIKKLDDAIADNDNILGTILAAGTNHSADAVSITHPHAGHQSYLARQTLRSAGVNPLDVSYVELHGTGTQAGDYEEMQGVLDVYAPNISPKRRSDQRLHIGGVKANVGHGESVAGTTALLKVLLMLQKQAIPPHVGIKTEINPRLAKDLDKRNVHIPFSAADWAQRADRKRLAVINNFGAAGGNTTMILEEGPTRPQLAESSARPKHVVSVSAKSKKALTGNLQRLITYLDNADDTVRLADLAYTTTARRHPHGFRVAASVADLAGAKKHLTAALEKVDSLSAVGRAGPPSIAFAFTGQGASHQSMSLELYRDVPSFRKHIHHLDAIAQAQGFPSFIPALDGSHHQDHVHQPVVTQLTLLCVEIALAEYWASLGITPDLVIGHSLGEYAAMQVAGVISANDAIFMVGRRAEMLQERCQVGSHCMMAVRASLAAIHDAAGEKPFTVACVNGPSDTVLSGTVEKMDDIAVTLEAAGFRCIKLPVAFAFHSEQTDPILDDFEAVCKTGVLFHEPKLPIISPLLGKVIFDGRSLSAEYVRHATREPVDFVSALETAHSVSSIADDTIWLEIGPHPVCANFIKSTLPSTQVALASFRRGENNWKTLSDSMATLHLAGVELDWNEFHSPFSNELRLLSLPTYAWDEKKYWLQYNGDWCLTKGNTYYGDKNDNRSTEKALTTPVYESLSSLVQRIIEVEIVDKAGRVVVQSDLMQRDFLAAAHGHRMNDCGVVTSSIHADIAYTLGDYFYRKFYPQAKSVDMDMANLVVTHGLIAHKGPTSVPQLIQITAHTEDIGTGVVDLTWQNVEADGSAAEPFATAKLVFGDSQAWMASWSPMVHLLQHRIESLQQMAANGLANRLSRNMAYTLFADKLVDYADKYRGMQSVVIDGLEAYAEVTLSTKDDGAKFTVPPYFIDSVAHLAGFVMNCSDSMDTQKNYCVTPGWQSMRFARKLVPGARYRSYVKMIPTAADPTVFLGDVYILSAEDNQIIGMVGGIQFRQFPRILLSRFFTAPAASKGSAEPAKAAAIKVAPKQVQAPVVMNRQPKSTTAVISNPVPVAVPAAHSASKPAKPSDDSSPASSASTASWEAIETPPSGEAQSSGAATIADKALLLIAQETALDVSDLEDTAEFAELGIDSLMSLVLTEKLRSDLGVKVNGSLFLDYPTIGDLRKWMVEYYN